ncbi:outer membrane protein [Roseicyclus persicicus]|uniref:Porin family protein n=1 Tax=Roseicyclus persicicus TaxID=2650661 RepID=A0A7X6GYK7_9RHOB|nr:hypothetical protein [Roseibacterium persicicum]NKX44029.1 hypothetical protein [Roseibacterium persicicum]
MKDTLFATLVAVASLGLSAGTAAADAAGPLALDGTASTQASVTYGPYLRFEIGGALTTLGDAYWLPPGQSDPQIDFDLDGDDVGFGAIAVGFDWQNGVRADLALLRTGDIGFAGPCASASDGSPCDGTQQANFLDQHADISDGSVHSAALMANLFYAPLEARGSAATFQPYVVAGLGLARNAVDYWTRVNPAATQPTRTFGSNTTTDLAWSIGIGASWQLTRPGDRPILLDVSLRHYDFGTAVGGSTSAQQGGIPREPLTFELTSQVLTVGLRIPLQRY